MHPWRVVPSVAPLAAVFSAGGERWDPVFHCCVRCIDILEAPVIRVIWAWARSSTGDLARFTGAVDAVVSADGISAPVVSLLAPKEGVARHHVGSHVRRRVNPPALLPFPRI